MKDNTLQLTIRGLDADTKAALVKKARRQGISLNGYALAALRQSAGVDETENRYLTLKTFLDTNHIDQADQQAFDEAMAWSDKASLEKQAKDERDSSL